jgi:hypothetical protein
MTISNPIHGVGLDRYSDWYWAFRDQKTIEALGANDFTTSAHNIFLDISSSGGFPLLITYLILLMLVLIKGMIVLSKMKKPDHAFIAIFASWIGFNVYSVIGIGQIGILIWGWIFSGLILSWNSISLESKLLPGLKFSKNRFLQIFMIAIGIIMIFPVAKDSYSIKQAQVINTPREYLSYLENNEIEPYNIGIAVRKLKEFGLEAEGLNYTRQALLRFPNNYTLLELQYSNKFSTNFEKQLAYNKLLALNYYNRYLAKLKKTS